MKTLKRGDKSMKKNQNIFFRIICIIILNKELKNNELYGLN